MKKIFMKRFTEHDVKSDAWHKAQMSAMGEILRPEVAQEVDTLQATILSLGLHSFCSPGGQALPIPITV